MAITTKTTLQRMQRVWKLKIEKHDGEKIKAESCNSPHVRQSVEGPILGVQWWEKDGNRERSVLGGIVNLDITMNETVLDE
jgi:hypothetical protein